MVPPRLRGHTLPELLTVVAILGMLLSIALPAFSDAIARHRLEATGEALVASLERARSTAIRRGHRTFVCASRRGRVCDPAPAWHRGWIAGDRDATALFDLSDHVPGRIRSEHRQGRGEVRFAPDGTSGGKNQAITLCVAGKPLTAFDVVISNVGRVRRGQAAMSDATACAKAAE